MEKASSAELSRAGKDLLSRADELIESQAGVNEYKLPPVAISFTPAQLPQISGSTVRLMGTLELKTEVQGRIFLCN